MEPGHRMDAARMLLRRVAKDHEDQHIDHQSGDQSDHRLAVIHEYDRCNFARNLQ